MQPNNISIECWVNDDLPSTDYSFEHARIRDDDIAGWLRLANARSSPNHGRSTAGLRLVCREKREATDKQTYEELTEYPFEESTFKEINEAMGIGHEYLRNCDAGSCGRLVKNLQEPVYIYHQPLSNSSFATMLRYNPEYNLTTGYAILGPDLDLEEVKLAIKSHYTTTSHPFLIPVLLTELNTKFRMRSLAEVHLQLRNIELKSGHGAWTIKKPIQSMSSQDYQALARKIGTLDGKLAFIEADVYSNMVRLEFTMKEVQAMRWYIPREILEKLEGVERQLIDRVQFLESKLEHMLFYGGIRQRLRAQQTVMFNLIAQQDSLLNVEVARDSKELAAASRRDSAAMKIIAFLTTLFLPGTFISTFFAMPLFDWTASRVQDVTTGHFWIYWAISIPLTVSVIGAVVAFSVYQTHGRKLDILAARKSATV